MGWMGWDGPSKGSIKLKLISFFVARSLPYRLPSGSSANLTSEADRPSFGLVNDKRTSKTNRVYRVVFASKFFIYGTDGYQKWPLIFLILRYIEHCTYKLIHI